MGCMGFVVGDKKKRKEKKRGGGKQAFMVFSKQEMLALAIFLASAMFEWEVVKGASFNSCPEGCNS